MQFIEMYKAISHVAKSDHIPREKSKERIPRLPRFSGFKKKHVYSHSWTRKIPYEQEIFFWDK